MRYLALGLAAGVVFVGGIDTYLALREKPVDRCLHAARLVHEVAKEEGDMAPPSVRKLYAECVWERSVNTYE